MNMDWNARRDILPASVGGSRLRRVAWRRSRKSDGGDCDRDGHIRSPPPSLHAARLCFIRRGPSRYRRIRCCVDIDPRVGGISLLADDSGGAPYPANDGACQPGYRFGDAPGRLYDHAGRMVMVGAAFADLRNLATSASVAREWQRSSLATFVPAVLRDGTARVTDICLEIDECLRRLLHQRDEGTGYNGAVDEERRVYGVMPSGFAQAKLR